MPENENYVLVKKGHSFYALVNVENIEKVPIRGIRVLPSNKFRILNYDKIIANTRKIVVQVVLDKKIYYFNVIDIGDGFFNLMLNTDYNCIIL